MATDPDGREADGRDKDLSLLVISDNTFIIDRIFMRIK